jgi:hypothetical protein
VGTSVKYGHLATLLIFLPVVAFHIEHRVEDCISIIVP